MSQLMDLHDLLNMNKWNEADALMHSPPDTVVEQLPYDHTGRDGCALHAVCHRPAPIWLQRNVLRHVARTRPALVNVKSGQSRSTPLHLATAAGQPRDFVNMLIDGKADLNAENKNRKTPLDLASLSSCWELEDLLDACGAKRTGPRIHNPGMSKKRYAEKRRR